MLKMLLISAGLMMTSLLQAQWCGTPQEPLLERIDEHKKSLIPVERGAMKYIPLTFHLVAATSGSGRGTEESVLNQIAALNVQYADQEAIYYLDRINYFDNDAVFNNPASTAARTQMRLRKDNNSINIFVTNTADSGSGTAGVVLAYYDSQDDWIVSRKDQIGNNATIAHELGHFFSLAHPHSGWECNPYTLADYGNPVNLNFTIPCEGGGGSVLIELHDRSNCEQAGDRLCDTPEDYNLGLFYQSNSCAQNNVVMDKNGDVIMPMTNNFMGYYSNCTSYAFTETQKTLINTDFFSFRRLYIRTGVIPNTTPVEGPVSYISPIGGEETPGPTNIRLDWEDVPGATQYLVVYDRFASFTFNPKKAIVSVSEFTIDETLGNGLTYHWRVWPFNESQTGAGYSQSQNFRVGTGVGVNDIREINDYTVSPNPASASATPLLTLSSISAFTAQLEVMDALGHVLSRLPVAVPSGISQYPVDNTGLTAGIYWVILHSEKGRLVERLLIMD